MPYIFPHSVPTPTGLSPREFFSVEGLTRAILAFVFAVVGALAGNTVVLYFAGASIILSAIFTLATAARSLMAPTQEQAG